MRSELWRWGRGCSELWKKHNFLSEQPVRSNYILWQTQPPIYMWLLSPLVKARMGVVENKCPFLCGYSCRLDYDHSHIIKISYHETLLLIALKRLISLLFTGKEFSGDIVKICLQKNDLGYFFVWQHYQPQAFILAFFWKFYSNIIHTKHIYYHSNILKEGIIDIL